MQINKTTCYSFQFAHENTVTRFKLVCMATFYWSVGQACLAGSPTEDLPAFKPSDIFTI